jgi:hypothetical protein
MRPSSANSASPVSRDPGDCELLVPLFSLGNESRLRRRLESFGERDRGQLLEPAHPVDEPTDPIAVSS